MKILLLRHGDCRTDGEKRYVGQLDLPLNDLGIRQAREWRDVFAADLPDRVISSDLTRAMQTAKVALEGLPVRIKPQPGLREISLGDWEGMARQDVRTRFSRAYARRGEDLAGFRPPNGESFQDLQTRVVGRFSALCAGCDPGETLLLVTHAGVIRVLLCHILGMDLQRLFTLAVDYARMVCLEGTPAGWVVRGVNLAPPGIGR
ncbi:histidine phosphatase family protein [Desulfoplanes sp. PS50]